MAVSQQHMAPIFDNRQQMERWKECLKDNNKKHARQGKKMNADTDAIIHLTQKMVNYPEETFFYRQLSANIDHYTARSIVVYLVKNGLLLKVTRRGKGFLYRRLFDAEDIPTIIKEQKGKTKTLTRKQHNFLREIKRKATSGIGVNIDQAIVIYYYYLKFRGILGDFNRIDYFACGEKKCRGMNSLVHSDIPLDFGQVRMLLCRGAKKNIFETRRRRRKVLYKFNDKIIRGGIEELNNALEKGGKMEHAE